MTGVNIYIYAVNENEMRDPAEKMTCLGGVTMNCHQLLHFHFTAALDDVYVCECSCISNAYVNDKFILCV